MPLAALRFQPLACSEKSKPLCGATHRRTPRHHMRSGRSTYANAKGQSSFFRLYKRITAQHRCRAYKYPCEQGDHLPEAREHHHQASAPTEAGRKWMARATLMWAGASVTSWRGPSWITTTARSTSTAQHVRFRIKRGHMDLTVSVLEPGRMRTHEP